VKAIHASDLSIGHDFRSQ